jgi:hypothetical protein
MVDGGLTMLPAVPDLPDNLGGRLDIALLLNDLSEGANLGALAARLAASISELQPATRVLIAQRLVAYASDLLVKPLSATGGRILDEANAKLTSLESRRAHTAANDG